jgi:Bacterial Ig domain
MPSLTGAAASSSSLRAGLKGFAFASFATLVIAYFWLIDAFAVNTIWVDQWSDLALIKQTYSGHLTLSALWAQHTDNRILFPNLVVLLLAKTSHFNVVDEAFLSACLLVIATTLLIVGHRRRLKSTPWVFYVPVAIVMLSFVQNNNTLWGFQFAWYLVLLALSVALFLCDDPKWNWLIAAGAMIAAVVGSYSSVQGLLIWPSGLVLLLLRRRSLPFVLTWIAAGIVTTAIYFVNFNTHNGASGDGYVFHHPIQGIRFFFFSVGNVTGAHGGNGSVVLGVLIVVMAVGLTLSVLIRPRGDDAAPLGIALICYGLLFALFTTDGRAAAGLNAGGASRYTTFNLLTLVGCYLVIISRRGAVFREGRNFKFLWWGSLGLVGVAVCLTLVLGTINGLSDSASWQKEQLQASEVIVNIKRAPDSMVERVLNVNPYYVPRWRALSAFAQQNNLNLFARADTVDLYRRAGLPYDANSLMTAMTSPKAGARVKGEVVLLASASSDYGVAKVDFEVSGTTGYRTELSGTKTPYGWLVEWNSTGLHNARYVIYSVAYDYASHRSNSGTVVVSLGS